MSHSELKAVTHWLDSTNATVAINGGHLNFAQSGNTMYVTDLFVEHQRRGQGLGEVLLREVMGAAIRTDVQRIIADLTSTAAIIVAERVFGEDAITVLAASAQESDMPGAAAPKPVPEQAFLNYQVPSQRPQ